MYVAAFVSIKIYEMLVLMRKIKTLEIMSSRIKDEKSAPIP
jgi:hypothetical protein